ncbi:Uclacyanin 1-like protein [Drosera capensis]
MRGGAWDLNCSLGSSTALLSKGGFAYSGALGNIVELATKQELDSCDLTNPIRMYTDGLDKLPLEKEGSRYFASGSHESCKKGLKLPIKVVPKWVMPETEINQLPTSEKASLAATPTSPPSDSSKIRGPMTVLFGIMILCNSFVL